MFREKNVSKNINIQFLCSFIKIYAAKFLLSIFKIYHRMLVRNI